MPMQVYGMRVRRRVDELEDIAAAARQGRQRRRDSVPSLPGPGPLVDGPEDPLRTAEKVGDRLFRAEGSLQRAEVRKLVLRIERRGARCREAERQRLGVGEIGTRDRARLQRRRLIRAPGLGGT